MLLFFRVIMCCLYNDYDYENSSSVNEAFSYEIIKYKLKNIKNGNNNFRPACFCMGIYRKQRRTAHFLQKGTAEEGKSFVALCATSSWLAYYIVDEKFFTAIIVGCVFAFILDLIMRRKISAKYRY